jgi:uncharacterized lipoprotein YajG
MDVPNSNPVSKHTLMKLSVFAVLSLVALLTSGCVFSGQTVQLMPTTSVASSTTGNGVAVSLKVTDERPDQAIGKRGVGGMGADLVPAQKVDVVVQSALTDALQKKGFTVVSSGDAAAKLSVEVRFLQYSLSTGFWSGGVNVKVALKAVASANGKNYERLYRKDREERVQLAPTASTNEKWINDALSQALQELIDDTALIETLAHKG